MRGTSAPPSPRNARLDVARGVLLVARVPGAEEIRIDVAAPRFHP